VRQKAQGDLNAARQSFDQHVAIFRRLAAADPLSVETQLALSSGLTEVGDVLRAQGDLAGARGRFEEGLDLARRLASANASSTSRRRDMRVSLN